MVKKTEYSRNLLLKALRELPQDNALQEVRYQIKNALNKLDHVENKRQKKTQQNETPQSQWQFDINKGLINPLTNKDTLATIEKMIELEQQKLEELKDKGKSNGNNEHMGTILD